MTNCVHAQTGACEARKCIRPNGRGCPIAQCINEQMREAIKKEMETVDGGAFKVWKHPMFQYRAKMILGNGNINLFCTYDDLTGFPGGQCKFKPGELTVVIKNDVYYVCSIGEVKTGDWKGCWRVVVRPSK